MAGGGRIGPRALASAMTKVYFSHSAKQNHYSGSVLRLLIIEL